MKWVGQKIPRKLIDLIHRYRDDRRVLDKIIFPYFVQDHAVSKILFIGCKWYTSRYNEIFQHKDYWTLEINPSRSKYGAENHIAASIEDVPLYFDENELDLIICNGVFGWGLNAKSCVERAFQNCFGCLREGGVFVLGWNDVPKRRPFPLKDCHALRVFNHYVFPPLSTSEYLTKTRNRHTYNFYVKPGRISS